ncbi:MAG: UDP-3-O-(3-hydroxymyristoyl)glucosamine N-acyltransferase, partial [Helicobacteraceae bacterium]|nr:UDP-3-O-(3-hydroxymyristoyl)glucosamine N-acyltransferase [Helicobacteraceae bacterium]
MELSRLAQALGLTLEAEDREIKRINTPDLAGKEDAVFLTSDKYLKDLSQTNAAVVFLRAEYKAIAPKSSVAIVCADPRLAFAKATAFFAQPLVKTDGKKAQIGRGCDISDLARIGKDTKIGSNCLIMAGVSIGDDVTIGDNVTLFPNVVIYNRTKIGDRVRIHAGTVIGSDGFGYATGKTGEHIKIRHLGRATIEDDVEIGANSAVDRAVLGETIVKRGAKLDNFVHIAHNCEIGEHSLITAHVVFAGSVKTGRNLVVGGHSGFNGHIEIAPFVTIAAKSGVTKSIKKSGIYAGFPAIEHGEWLRQQVRLAKI